MPQVALASQCLTGPLRPELYHCGVAALAMGCEAGERNQMQGLEPVLCPMHGSVARILSYKTTALKTR